MNILITYVSSLPFTRRIAHILMLHPIVTVTVVAAHPIVHLVLSTLANSEFEGIEESGCSTVIECR